MIRNLLIAYLSLTLVGMIAHASLYGTDHKVINLQCEKRPSFDTLIHVGDSQDAIVLHDVYCPYISEKDVNDMMKPRPK